MRDVLRDVSGNRPPLPGIFPDCVAPVVRNASVGTPELTVLCWSSASRAEASCCSRAFRERVPACWLAFSGMVCARRQPSARFLCRELDALDLSAHRGANSRKTMSEILRTADEIEHWLTAPPGEALKLQRPLPDNSLQVVAHEKRAIMFG